MQARRRFRPTNRRRPYRAAANRTAMVYRSAPKTLAKIDWVYSATQHLQVMDPGAMICRLLVTPSQLSVNNDIDEVHIAASTSVQAALRNHTRLVFTRSYFSVDLASQTNQCLVRISYAVVPFSLFQGGAPGWGMTGAQLLARLGAHQLTVPVGPASEKFTLSARGSTPNPSRSPPAGGSSRNGF